MKTLLLKLALCAALLLLYPSGNLWAAIALVNTASGDGPSGGGGSTTIATGAFSATTGNLLHVDVTVLNASVVSVTDTAGNTYTQIRSATPTTNSRHQHVNYYAKNITGNASNVVTVTLSGADIGGAAVVLQYSGLDTTSPLDANPAAGDGGPYGTPSSGSFTTTFSNEVIVMGCAWDDVFSSNTAGSGYTMEVNDTRTLVYAEDKIVSTIQTSHTPTMTSIAFYNCLAATYKSASGGASAPTVTTTTASMITSNSAQSGGTVSSNGGAAVSSEGVCYGLSLNPTTPCTSDGTVTPFASSLTGLAASTLYHYRAFATNAAGTGYGSDATFTTAAGGSPPVSAVHAVNGTVDFGGAVVKIPVNGQMLFYSGVPAVSSCGTGPSLTGPGPAGVGTNNAGTITVGSGTVTACTVTFSQAFSTAPTCSVKTNSATIAGNITSVTVNAAVFGFSADIGGGVVYYTCF